MPRANLRLDDAWRTWLVENLLGGVAPRALEDRLAGEGVPRALARREIAAIRSSPLLPACAHLVRRATRLELVAALGRGHARHAPGGDAVERRATPDEQAFFRDYWAAHRPVVLTDAMRGWPALARWSPAWLKAHFGAQRVEVTVDRERDPDYDANFTAHRKTMRLGRFVDLVLAAGASNDLYMVSNNRTMRRKAFAPLYDDLTPLPAFLDPARLRGAVSLWFGPAGTVTPLHHDTTNILLCQVVGRKRVELVSPEETALLDGARGFYHGVDLDRLAEASHPALRAMRVLRTTLGPGDALYLPAGWWHRVTSLDVSISLSLLAFRRPNDFDWYRPGQV